MATAQRGYINDKMRALLEKELAQLQCSAASSLRKVRSCLYLLQIAAGERGQNWQLPEPDKFLMGEIKYFLKVRRARRPAARKQAMVATVKP